MTNPAVPDLQLDQHGLLGAPKGAIPFTFAGLATGAGVLNVVCRFGASSYQPWVTLTAIRVTYVDASATPTFWNAEINTTNWEKTRGAVSGYLTVGSGPLNALPSQNGSGNYGGSWDGIQHLGRVYKSTNGELVVNADASATGSLLVEVTGWRTDYPAWGWNNTRV